MSQKRSGAVFSFRKVCRSQMMANKQDMKPSHPALCDLQETTADELEEAYRGEIWNPARGHIEEQKQGITAARVDLRTMTQECKVKFMHGLAALRLCQTEQMHCRTEAVQQSRVVLIRLAQYSQMLTHH